MTRPLHMRVQLYRESLARNAQKYEAMGLRNTTMRAEMFTETLGLLLSASRDERTLTSLLKDASGELHGNAEWLLDWARSEARATWDGHTDCDWERVLHLRRASDECKRQAAQLLALLGPEDRPDVRIQKPEFKTIPAWMVGKLNIRDED